MSIKPMFRSHRVALLLLAATATAIALFVLSPAFAVSSNPCSPCHGSQGYSQTLSVTGGTLPTTLTVGQSATVTAVLKNNVVGATRYTSLSGVSATISSQNSHFTVTSPTVNVGNLASGGSATVSWTVTAVSPGADAFVIKASASNTHQGLSFSDGISASTTIVAPPTPTPTQTSTPVPTPVPTQTPTPTAIPTPIQTLAPTPTPTSIPSPTPIQTPAATLFPTPTATPLLSPTPTPTPTLDPTTAPSTTPAPVSSQAPVTTPTQTPTSTATQPPTPAATSIPTATPSLTTTTTPPTEPPTTTQVPPQLTQQPATSTMPAAKSQPKPYVETIAGVLLYGSVPFAVLAISVAMMLKATKPMQSGRPGKPTRATPKSVKLDDSA